MNKNVILSAVSALLLGLAVIPVTASDCPGFLPPNDMKIPVGSDRDRGMAEAQFNSVLDTIEKIYTPMFSALGKTLEVRRLWTDETVNASAQQNGNNVILNMYGGLARHEAVTMDGFALVACHELGHHVGGAPKQSWASIEGQSDYYANLKCLRLVFADSTAKAFTRTEASSDETARKACKAAWKNTDDQNTCLRSAMAGKSVSYLFKSLSHATSAPGYDTPDTKVVTTMFTDHPATQCRMDTYLAGSVCTQPVSAKLSDTNPAPGTCTRSGGFKAGFRPLCWYKPPTSENMFLGFDIPGVNTDAAVVPGPVFSMLNSDIAW